MELLAPAGNLEQAKAAIYAGSNALYGGLKQWSARNRAQNFSIEEYEELLSFCHNKNVKFYLTVNTLLHNEELEDFRNFLLSSRVSCPDAILVADLGVISVLRNEFPQIKIYASTQFGACSLEDVQFLERMGIQRVVLARELTLKEIEYIRENTTTELEVFVYGAQCISFSGNCMWGGLLHLGSGNRGRCIGICNDILYTDSGRIGQFLYPREIGLFGMVKQLSNIGVDSIKIEGRLRPAEEIEEVVRRFRRAIDGSVDQNTDRYDGYLGGTLPATGMFADVNPDTKSRIINDMEFIAEDFLIDHNQEKRHFVTGQQTFSKEYVRTVFSNPIKDNDINLRIRLLYKDNRITFVDYVNMYGERTLYELTEGEDTEVTVQEIYKQLKAGIDANIYECITGIPGKSIVMVNQSSIKRIAEAINFDVSAIREKNIVYTKSAEIPSKEATIFTDDSAELELLHAKGYQRFIFQIKNIIVLEECLDYETNHDEINIIYQLPFLDFNKRVEDIYPLLQGKKVMITRISQLIAAEKYNFGQIYANYMLNVWNSTGALWLKSLGVKALIAHPELSFEEMKRIEKETGLEILFIRAGKIPLGLTRACLKETGLCNSQCDNSIVSLCNVTKGGTVHFVCNNIFGFRTILSEKNFVSVEEGDMQKQIFVLAGMNKQQRQGIFTGSPDLYYDAQEIYQRWS